MAEKKISISTARSRFNQRGWKNETLTWEDLRERFSTPTVTAETVAEYSAMSREKRVDVKDVGGFVGGWLTDGRRRVENVLTRDLLTYDYDEFSPEGLERVRDAMSGMAWCLYSTHTHTEEDWRVRIIIPTSRSLQPDEFPAVARKVAEKLGFEGLDKGSFDLNRLMFWPSVSKDGAFLFESGEGMFLNVDAIKAEYADWRDASQWPLLPDESAAGLFGADIPGRFMAGMSRRGNGGKKEDPAEKKGIVGAFCRTYDIPAAIAKFLGHLYQPAANGHYTHIGSSTVGNAMVREGGKFLYSFHGTDPLQRMMLNSWDLVRLALFRHQDEGAAEDTRTARLPSTKAMEELALKDIAVKKRYMEEKGNDFEGLTADSSSEEEPNPLREIAEEVIAGLDVKKNGVEVKASNIDYILNHDPKLKDRFRLDVFRGNIEILGELPWKTHSKYWSDSDTDSFLTYFDKVYDMRKNTQIIERTFADYLNNHSIHPVKAYLENLPEWDGEKRLCRLFTDVLGAEDTPLNRRLSELIFTAAVRRIENPGEKYDYCVILHGPEGAYKSTLFAVMAGEWFSDSISSIEGKQGMESLEGVWIAEISELTGLKKSELATQKAFISRQFDKFRPAYGKRTVTRPRQCVMVGTTNEDYFLKGINDKNRRMPVVEIDPKLRKIEENPRDWLLEHRDQLWAEAKVIEKKKQALYLGNKYEKEIKDVQERHNMDLDDPMFSALQDFLDWYVDIDWNEISVDDRKARVTSDPHNPVTPIGLMRKKRDRVTIPEIMEECLKVPKSNPNYRSLARQMGQYMKRLPDWKFLACQRGSYGIQKTWERIKSVTEENEVFGYALKNPLIDL